MGFSGGLKPVALCNFKKIIFGGHFLLYLIMLDEEADRKQDKRKGSDMQQRLPARIE